MRYGFFDDAAREYVITDPCTPVKWTNYVGTLAFGGLIDQTGGSVICKGDPSHNRITKYIPQLPSSDFKGETLYLRQKRADGSYHVFSPFFVPTLTRYDRYECHVGLGYQRIVSEMFGVRTEVTVFVPVGASVVLRDIRVTNTGLSTVSLDVIPVVEYSHFDALKQYTNADWCPQTMMVDACTEPEGLVVLRQYAFMKKNSAVNFFTSNAPVDSFQTDRKKFLGHNEYGSWKNPLELQNEKLSNYEARRGDTITALMHNLSRLAPGETRRIITQLGQASPEAVPAIINKYRDEKTVDASLTELCEFWDGYLARCIIQTPDAAFDSMVNIHNPRQCHTTFNWSRYLSLYQLGLGSRGLGFRDSSQDCMAVLASIPEEAKKLLIKLLSVQRPDGSAMHQFYPATMHADEGDSLEDGGKLVYGDDHLWIVLAVCAYLKETGDYGVLGQTVTFYDKKLPVEKREKSTVLDHLKRALAYTKANTGRHGLPLLGYADWNDTVNLPGDAESLFNANLYGAALLEMISLADYLDDSASAKAWAKDYAEMKKAVNLHAWDGEWYVRYFTESGEPLGSKKNRHGSIYTNGQSWPVISGFATPERARQALDSVFKHLNTECGIKLSGPGFDGYDPETGGITTYPPGAKENGGIFLHSNPWVMIAETMLGNGDRAFQYYRQINPAAKNDDIDRYECEPYCYAQNILGDEHPQFGLGRNSWLSGTSSWTYQAATQYIIGLRPQHDGLLIDPCIPHEWAGFSAVRKFRGATIRIKVKNPEHVCKGIAAVKVDGVSLKGCLLPVFEPDTEHTVEVTMGSKS